MCVQSQWTFAFPLNVIVLFAFVHITNADSYCAKVDFNRATLPRDFRECQGKYLPVFTMQQYSETPFIKPNRTSSEYYLTAKSEGSTCIETTQKFNLNVSSYIDTSVLLTFTNPGAYFQIMVYDSDRNVPFYAWKIDDSSTEWRLIHGRVGQKPIARAKIEITTNMNKGSRVAVEYVNILNSAINTEECYEDTKQTTQTTSTPSAPTTTLLESTIETSEETSHEEATTQSSASTANEESNSILLENIWILVSGLLAILFFATLLALICVLIHHYRYRITATPLNAVSTAADGELKKQPIYASHTSLPRLCVVNDNENGVSIVGTDGAVKHKL